MATTNSAFQLLQADTAVHEASVTYEFYNLDNSSSATILSYDAHATMNTSSSAYPDTSTMNTMITTTTSAYNSSSPTATSSGTMSVSSALNSTTASNFGPRAISNSNWKLSGALGLMVVLGMIA